MRSDGAPGEHGLDPATREKGSARLDPQVGDHETGLAEALALLHDVQVLTVHGGLPRVDARMRPRSPTAAALSSEPSTRRSGMRPMGRPNCMTRGREESLELVVRGVIPGPVRAPASSTARSGGRRRRRRR